MKNHSKGYLHTRIHNRKRHSPLSGQIELTYRCYLGCVHCYCKGSEDKGRELSAESWKDILDTIHREGCLWLTFTGGDPLIREDFLEIYSYAKSKGFIISLFTSGHSLNGEILKYLKKSPPNSIEISLYGLTEGVHESITQVRGSYNKLINNIKMLKKFGMPLILKTVCLKQNKHQIGRMKVFAEKLLDKSVKGRYWFKYDPMIFPRLNGDTTPSNYRLDSKEISEVCRQDPDIWREYERSKHADIPELERDRKYLYRCNSWMQQFYIGPYGRLKFCDLTEKFSVDLKKTPFREGFYEVFPKLLKEKFRTDYKCRDCRLRAICYHCPVRAHLETGDEEAPVEYYCHLAEESVKQTRT